MPVIGPSFGGKDELGGCSRRAAQQTCRASWSRARAESSASRRT